MPVCNFKSSGAYNCSANTLALNTLPLEEQCIILTETGLLPSHITQTFSVCTSHLDILFAQNKAHRKSKLCGIPNLISSHQKENKIYGGCHGVKADRNVSMEKVQTIHAHTGIIIPVGTRK